MSDRPNAFRIDVSMGGAAFDANMRGELARILRDLAHRVENGDGWHAIAVRDVNGNAIGRAEYWGAPPAMITIEEWFAKYEPIHGGDQGCCGFDGREYGFHAFAPAVDFAAANGIDDVDRHVWTITHDDDEDECTYGGAWTVAPGIHRVNVVGFVITRKPHDGSEVAEWA